MAQLEASSSQLPQKNIQGLQEQVPATFPSPFHPIEGAPGELNKTLLGSEVAGPHP
jgi:hypothetical protein